MSVSEHCTDRCLVLTCSRMSEPPVRAVRTGAPGVPKKRVKHGKFLTKTYETVITYIRAKPCGREDWEPLKIKNRIVYQYNY